MTTLREAAQQALEALKGKRYTACGWRSDCDKAITALRAALAEPTGKEDLQVPLTEEALIGLVQIVVSTSERPIGMVAFGSQVARAIERAHGIGGNDE